MLPIIEWGMISLCLVGKFVFVTKVFLSLIHAFLLLQDGRLQQLPDYYHRSSFARWFCFWRRIVFGCNDEVMFLDDFGIF